MKLYSVLLSLWMVVATSAANPTGPYMGQEPPGLTPKLFAPGFISLPDRREAFITFSPDGNECFFTEHQKEWAPYWVYQSVQQGGGWTTPKKASFSNQYSLCPSISADGTKLIFSKNSSVFQCQRLALGQWSSPVQLPSPVSSSAYEFSCHLSDKGTMYVCSWRGGGLGGCDGWAIPSVDGQWQAAQNLRSLNSAVGDCCFVPGPNEAYLIFQSRRPPTGGKGGFFGTDLFISFATPEGGWTAPRNLGQTINSPDTDGFPWVSHDGRYLFFASDRNGTNDIFWVETRAFLPDPNGPVENLNVGVRYPTIQSAMIHAQSGDMLEIQGGLYRESLLIEQPLTIRSVDPNDPLCVGATLIQGNSNHPIITLSNTSAACQLNGLTLRAGSVGIQATASHATIRNCRIMDNTTHGIELFHGSSPYLEHCLITANGQTGITMYSTGGRRKTICKPTLVNCTVSNNGEDALVGGQPIIVDSIISD